MTKDDIPETENTTPLGLVGQLNDEIWHALFEGKTYKEQADSHLFALTYVGDGFTYEGILFMDIVMWDNNDNNIPWDDTKNERAFTFRDFVLNQVRETIEKLGPLALFCKSQTTAKQVPTTEPSEPMPANLLEVKNPYGAGHGFDNDT